MVRDRKRQAHGTACHRKFDDCWYATIDGRRARLWDEAGQPIKGKDVRTVRWRTIRLLSLNYSTVMVTSNVTASAPEGTMRNRNTTFVTPFGIANPP